MVPDLWVWESCVAGKAIGYQRFKDGKKDGDYTSMGQANEFTLKGGYLSFVSSDANMIDTLLIYMQSDANGYVKDVEVINNGLGGVTPETLIDNKVKYETGGEITMKDAKSDFIDELLNLADFPISLRFAS